MHSAIACAQSAKGSTVATLLRIFPGTAQCRRKVCARTQAILLSVRADEGEAVQSERPLGRQAGADSLHTFHRVQPDRGRGSHLGGRRRPRCVHKHRREQAVKKGATASSEADTAQEADETCPPPRSEHQNQHHAQDADREAERACETNAAMGRHERDWRGLLASSSTVAVGGGGARRGNAGTRNGAIPSLALLGQGAQIRGVHDRGNVGAPGKV